MKDWRLAVGKLNEVVEGTSVSLSTGEKAGLYAGARVLLADLKEDGRIGAIRHGVCKLPVRG